jgi:hypothetical protein
MRAVVLVALTLAIAACRGDRDQAPARSKPAPTDTESDRALFARSLAGCYLFADDSIGPYRVQLDARRDAQVWAARLVGPGATSNRAGNEWSWTPAGPGGFGVHWAGIDGVMDFAVQRHDSGWSAVAEVVSASGGRPVRIPIRAERIECPSPGA